MKQQPFGVTISQLFHLAFITLDPLPCGSRVKPNSNKKEYNIHLTLEKNANCLSVFSQNVLTFFSSQKDLYGANPQVFLFQSNDRPACTEHLINSPSCDGRCGNKSDQLLYHMAKLLKTTSVKDSCSSYHLSIPRPWWQFRCLVSAGSFN